MSSLRLRSPRDPEFWLPLAASIVFVLAFGVGVWLWMSGYSERVRLLAKADPAAALDETLTVLRIASGTFCLMLAAFSVYFFRYCQLGHRQGRLPPTGWWSYGSLRAVTGERAQRTARFGQGLAAVLLLASIGFVVGVEYLARLMQSGEFTL